MDYNRVVKDLNGHTEEAFIGFRKSIHSNKSRRCI
jgi:hypothetical protein